MLSSINFTIYYSLTKHSILDVAAALDPPLGQKIDQHLMLFCGIRIIYQALNLNLPKFEISCDRLGVLIYTCQIARAVPIYKYGGSLNIVDIINKNLFDFVYVVLVHASVILGNLMLVLWQDLLSSKVSLEKKSQITK